MSCNSKGGTKGASGENAKDISKKLEEEEKNISDAKKMEPEIESSERENLKRLRSYSDHEYYKRRRIASPTHRGKISPPELLSQSPQPPQSQYQRYINRAQTDRQSAPFEEIVSTKIRRGPIAAMPGNFFDDMLLSRPETGMMKEGIRGYEEMRRNSDLQLVEQEMLTSRRMASLPSKRSEYFYDDRHSGYDNRSFRSVYMDEMRVAKEAAPTSYGHQHFDRMRNVY